jgi:lipopolysaccharide transport system permease protein
MQTPLPGDMGLREAKPATGHGLLYACRTARAWWYSAWLRTLARFSRTTLGSFWMGLSNLLTETPNRIMVTAMNTNVWHR